MEKRTTTIDAQIRAGLRTHQVHLLEGSRCTFLSAALAEPPFAPMAGMTIPLAARFGAFSYSYSLLNQVEGIGRYCSIADFVFFAGIEHPTDRATTSSFSYDPTYIWRTFREAVGADYPVAPRPGGGKYGPIRLGHDVWIGTGAYIRGGVTIGNGAIVGARAVVTRNVPPYAIVAGNPARVVKQRLEPGLAAAVEASNWWDYAFTDLAGLPTEEPGRFVDGLARRVAAGAIRPYRPEPIDLETLLAALSPTRT